MDPRRLLIAILLLVTSVTIASCDDDVVRSDPDLVHPVPFQIVRAMGDLFGDGVVVIVIDNGGRYVTFDGETFSYPRAIDDLFAGPAPFDEIGAIGRGVVFDRSGTRFTNPADERGDVYDVADLRIDFPVGAYSYSYLDGVQYFFEKGGTRYAARGSGVNEEGTTPYPIDAMGVVDHHVVQVHGNGRLLDTFLWNEPDIRHALQTNQPLEHLLDLPATGEISSVNFSGRGCDPDGSGEYTVTVRITANGEPLAEYVDVEVDRYERLNDLPIRFEGPGRFPVRLDVTLVCTEYDLFKVDEHMRGRTAHGSVTLFPDGTMSVPTYSGRGVGRVEIAPVFDCGAELTFWLERAP